jgi:[ribosomal protein S5]-alanine N-acetyltransferase
LSRKIILETPRLYLYEMALEDAADFYELNSDPDVMRYTGDDSFDDVEAARNLVRNYKQYELHGYGRWTMVNKQTGEFIGWCGIRYFDEIGQTDIGYRLLKKHWNNGYATEAAQASINFGFTHFGLQRIIGRAHKDNGASIRVFEKLGLGFEKFYIEDNQQHVLYSINKDTWKINES